MKRDARLWRLSGEHHHALVLARELSRHVASHAADAPVVRDLRGRFDRELEPLGQLIIHQFLQCDRVKKLHHAVVE